MVRVFLTGITGYTGGDIFHVLNEAHPDYEYSVLVRNESKAAPVKQRYPNIRVVYGSLDDSKLLEEEAAKTDILVHTADASDHEGAAKAFTAGLAAGHSKDNPAYWIHTGGTGILTYQDADADRYGEALAYEPYNDLEGVDALTHLPDHAFHRNVDKIVLAAGENPAIKSAIICPPTIYGKGRGVGNTTSRQVYVMARTTLIRGKAPIIGSGKSEWDHVHVHDLSDLYLRMVNAAVSLSPEIDSHIWGPAEGYLLADGGVHLWSEVAQWVADAAHAKGYIKEAALELTDSAKSLEVTYAKEIAGFEAVSYGLNSRGQGKRARKYLGWNPTGPSLKKEVPNIVDVEAGSLGLKPSQF
ncbi:dTDP-glucose 4,6-dehydratase [Cytospora mali]|uniref:dTDP-glucose 4,6-dehydratase n=1 Tax=Cytospora mali TaxID=578113 RepID=A0A194V8R8_CYTMA|nr:dTDP-glucose 4,6-dehydratase [Valsa mali var. pyri (nom. inval.)]